MKNLLNTIILITTGIVLKAQPVGYYNGTEGKTGEELKNVLHNIIKNHTAWEYSYSKNVFSLSDRDPSNPANVICVYTGRSEPWNNYGTGGNFLNREHVWAKSHGNFGESKPTGSDYHNLKPCDASVNEDRSNKDFDICQGLPGAQQHNEATGCYFTPNAWEPRDAVKGDIARMIFYMDTRYQGDNGEINLQVVDELNTYPQAKHGKLSALYQWNTTDLPDDFEINRNNVIYGFQKNRNPFIDNPNWISMIWGDMPADPISIGNMAQSVEVVTPTLSVTITATIAGQGTISAVLKWGTSYFNLENTVAMTLSAGTYSATIPSQTGNTNVFLKVEATNGTNTCSSVTYSYKVQPSFAGTITPIIQVQGQTSASPMENQVVTVTGVVTGNYGQGYFVQDAPQAWSGLYIYDIGRNPEIGDSVIITGKITEYYQLTEMTEVSHYQLVAKNKPLPEPIIITTGEQKEPYESVLVKVINGQVTSTNEGFGLWKIDDGSGYVMVHNTMIYNYTPIMGEYYVVTGPLTFDFDEWKIELRSESDVQPGIDMDKPYITELNMAAEDYIWLYFNEPVSTEHIGDLNNYTFNSNMSVVSANRHAIQTHVIILNVAGATVGVHNLTVKNITDLAGNVMNEQTIDFFSQFNGIDNEDIGDEIKIYPNPAFNTAIKFENIDKVSFVDIFDVSGRNIYHFSNNQNSNVIILNKLPQGVLFVKLHKHDGYIITKRIVIY